MPCIYIYIYIYIQLFVFIWCWSSLRSKIVSLISIIEVRRTLPCISNLISTCKLIPWVLEAQLKIWMAWFFYRIEAISVPDLKKLTLRQHWPHKCMNSLCLFSCLDFWGKTPNFNVTWTMPINSLIITAQYSLMVMFSTKFYRPANWLFLFCLKV